ncbi:MAG: YbhB/YbcL family Raf kinase inhibitor-like protein [Paracoccaceae bacterium]
MHILTAPMLAAGITLACTLPLQAFELTFEWGALKLCTSGSPNTVTNPTFILTDVPPGTRFIRFKLVDNDAPGYRHGGGTIAYSGADTILPGAFSYKSPCPPNGSHTYVWHATAQRAKNGGVIKVATSAKDYP